MDGLAEGGYAVVLLMERTFKPPPDGFRVLPEVHYGMDDDAVSLDHVKYSAGKSGHHQPAIAIEVQTTHKRKSADQSGGLIQLLQKAPPRPLEQCSMTS